jgi:hypothetical protein
MKRLFLTTLGLCLAAVGADAADGFDNPSWGGAPCLVLNDYQVRTSRVADETVFRANATVENICGRTLEVAFCFLYAEPTEEDVDRSCHSAVMRPWTRAQAQAPSAPTRIVGTDYQWRFLTEGLGS